MVKDGEGLCSGRRSAAARPLLLLLWSEPVVSWAPDSWEQLGAVAALLEACVDSVPIEMANAVNRMTSREPWSGGKAEMEPLSIGRTLVLWARALLGPDGLLYIYRVVCSIDVCIYMYRCM